MLITIIELVLIFFLIISIAITCYAYFNIRKLTAVQLLDTEKKVKELPHSKKQVNHRKAFRLEVGSKPCIIKLEDIGDDKLARDKKIQGFITDISVTGLKFVSAQDIPVRKKVFVKIIFDMEGEFFTFKAEIVRKEEHIEHNNVTYGVKFISTDKINHTKLASILNRIQLEQRKKFV